MYFYFWIEMKERKKGGTKVRRSKIGDDMGMVDPCGVRKSWQAHVHELILTIVPLCGNTCTVDDINEINLAYFKHNF